MKKILIMVTVFMVSATGLFAQQQAGDWTIGARFGRAFGTNGDMDLGYAIQREMTATFPTNAILISENNLSNYTFALYGNYAFTNRLAVQTELKFMLNQGYTMNLRVRALGAGSWALPFIYTNAVEVTYTSLDIPILLRFNLSNRAFIFGVQAGSHISIPLGRVEISQNNSSDKFDIKTLATFGFTLGFFSGFQAGPGRVVGDLRFFSDTTGTEVNFNGWEGEFMRRSALVVTVGYEISF